MITPEEIIDKYLGIKYIDNGRDPKIGLDCWGISCCIVNDIFKVVMPDPEYRKFSLLRHKEDIVRNHNMSHWVNLVIGQPIFGDFVLINALKNLPIHVGIYMKSGRFIHAISGMGVVLGEIELWQNKIEGIYRLKEKHTPND